MTKPLRSFLPAVPEVAFEALVEAAGRSDRPGIARAFEAVRPAVVAAVRSQCASVRGMLVKARLEPADVEGHVVAQLLARYPGGDGTTSARGRVLRWAMRTASNFVANEHRRAHHRLRTEPRVDDDGEGSPIGFQSEIHEGAEEELDRRRLGALLLECAHALEAPYSDVFSLLESADEEPSTDALILALELVEGAELAAYASEARSSEIRVRIDRARNRVDGWKRRMRVQLGECIEGVLGPGVLPSGLRSRAGSQR